MYTWAFALGITEAANQIEGVVLLGVLALIAGVFAGVILRYLQ